MLPAFESWETIALGLIQPGFTFLDKVQQGTLGCVLGQSGAPGIKPLFLTIEARPEGVIIKSAAVFQTRFELLESPVMVHS